MTLRSLRENEDMQWPASFLLPLCGRKKDGLKQRTPSQGDQQASPARKAGKLTAGLHLSLHFLKPVPQAHPQLCSRTPAAVSLPLLRPSPVDHTDGSLQTSFFPTIGLSYPPTPAGTPQEPTGHSDYGSKMVNHRSSLSPPFLHV